MRHSERLGKFYYEEEVNKSAIEKVILLDQTKCVRQKFSSSWFTARKHLWDRFIKKFGTNK